MTVQQLQDKVTIIDKLIYSDITSTQEQTYSICDGIIDISKYLAAKYKILWILKEPYDSINAEGKPYGGGWHIKDAINARKTFLEFTGGKKTYEPMIYISWGILNGFPLRSDMNSIKTDHTMLDALKSIAYINVKKIPGFMTSTPNTIHKAYDKHKDILFKQMECIDADIIIGGGTLDLFMKDLGLTSMKKFGSNSYTVKNEKLYIRAYHPAYRPSTTGVSHEQYCNDIITIAQKWATNTF